MKCEICHQAEAETVIRETADGEARERFVCQGCAGRARGAAGEPDTPSLVVEILLGAALSLPAADARGRKRGGEQPCPACGMTRQEYRKRSRLGCSGCYDHFVRELQPVLRDMHRGDRHTGKVPRQACLTVARQRLEASLAEAVARQQFEQAALLRDQLRALEAAPDTPLAGTRRRHA